MRPHLEHRRAEARHLLAGFGPELLVAWSAAAESWSGVIGFVHCPSRGHSDTFGHHGRHQSDPPAPDAGPARAHAGLGRARKRAAGVPRRPVSGPRAWSRIATLAWHPVGAPEPWPGTLAFLDGVQRSELVGYAGSAPIVVGEIAAAVRERSDRKLVTVLEERRLLVVARPAALAAAGDLPEACAPWRSPSTTRRIRCATSPTLAGRSIGPAAPSSSSWASATAAGPRDGSSWTARSPRARAGRLIRACSASPRATRRCRSRASDLDRYLRLPPGHRSSVYAPETRSLTPVHEWALRLWPWEGKDLFHGLVRIEVAPANGTSGGRRPALALAPGRARAAQHARTTAGTGCSTASTRSKPTSAPAAAAWPERVAERWPRPLLVSSPTRHIPRMSHPPPLGRVVATELKPSTPHQFHFWTARESPVGIGAIVRVEESGRVVYGVVTDGFAYSDLVTPDARRHRRRRRPGRRRARADASGPRSGSSPPRCCARCPRSRCSRCRSARCGSRAMPTWCSRSAWTPTRRRARHRHSGRALRRRRPRVARSTSTAISCSARRPRTSTSPACPGSPPRPAPSSSCSAASSRPFPRTRAASRRSAST